MKWWKRIIYSDESKFNLVGSDGKQYCRRRVGEEYLDRNVWKTVKHGGGSLMVWGCITWNGTGRLHRIQGIMKADQFCRILDESLLGTIFDHDMDCSSVIFQQDNDPKHTSKLGKAWLRDHQIRTLPWPPSSPDMNIIEHVWDYVDHQVRHRKVFPRNLDELWTALQEEWANVDLQYIRRLYKSIPRRVAALHRVKGGYTKY